MIKVVPRSPVSIVSSVALTISSFAAALHGSEVVYRLFRALRGGSARLRRRRGRPGAQDARA